MAGYSCTNFPFLYWSRNLGAIWSKGEFKGDFRKEVVVYRILPNLRLADKVWQRVLVAGLAGV